MDLRMFCVLLLLLIPLFSNSDDVDCRTEGFSGNGILSGFRKCSWHYGNKFLDSYPIMIFFK